LFLLGDFTVTHNTRLAADLTRRIAHGLPWPDGKPMTLPPETLVLWVMADNNHDEMVGLGHAFDIMGSVRVNSHKLAPYDGTSLDDPLALWRLEKHIQLTGAKLVYIDTVGNSTDKNLCRQEEAMRYYRPLQEIARRQNCSIICITHLNAGGTVLGRRATEKVRMVLKLDHPDPEGEPNRRCLQVVKSNQKYPSALGVTMGDGGNEYDSEPPRKPEDEPGKRGPDALKVRECADFLVGWMVDPVGKPMNKPVAAAISASEAAGFTRTTYYRAVELLGWTSELQGKRKILCIAQDPFDEQEDAQS
jgi:hypothetical protein